MPVQNESIRAAAPYTTSVSEQVKKRRASLIGERFDAQIAFVSRTVSGVRLVDADPP